MRLFVGIAMAVLAVLGAFLCVSNALAGCQPVALLLGALAVIAFIVAAKIVKPYIWGILRSREDI